MLCLRGRAELFLIVFSIIANVHCASFKGSSELETNVQEIRRRLDHMNVDTNGYTDLKAIVTQQSQTLDRIDERIEKIHEKSQIWATYEHYITSWIDQMSAVDRKLDIVIKSQERLSTLETKLNTLSDQIAKIDFDQFEHIAKKIEQLQEQNVPTTTTTAKAKTNDIFTLIDEYTTRGVLSSLNRIESKIFDGHNDAKSIDWSVNNNNKTMEMLSDIASKVDVIFDKMCTKYPDIVTEEDRDTSSEVTSVEDKVWTSNGNQGSEETGLCNDFNNFRQAPEAKYTTCVQINNKTWTLIQRRNSLKGTEKHVEFNRTWADYAKGFGNVDWEFWSGNDYLHRESEKNDLVLRIELDDFNGNTAWAEYNEFSVSDADDNYKVSVYGYRGNATDSFSLHNGAAFSTFDRNNDEAPECCPCAVSFGSGWWFKKCFESNLNGVYFEDPTAIDYYNGIIWEGWLGNYSLRRTRMMIRKA